MLNNVCLQGIMKDDPSFRKSNEGVSYCSFVLAVKRPKSMRTRSDSDYIPCIAWGDTADYISKVFHSGDMVVANGYIQSREYTKKNGAIGKAYEVNVSECNMCTKSTKKSSVGGDVIDWNKITKDNSEDL